MSQKYKLLTKCIITALHPNEPQKKGVVWEPKDDDAKAEAEALATVGYAQKTNEDVTDPTFARAATQATPEDVSDDDRAEMEEVLLGTVDEVVAGLGEYTIEGLDALAALETAGKGRKGVLDGISAAREAAVADAEAGDK